jgi:3'(2'), 5'-bisphosphate nucleotidase
MRYYTALKWLDLAHNFLKVDYMGRPEIDIHEIVNIAVEAGHRVLDIYRSDDFRVEEKQDESPLTLADRESHRIIHERLTAAYPGIPVLSEEGKETPYAERSAWEYFWLVDPLDGTKEFINRNGEFTINIALIEGNRPVAGVIYAPVLDLCYYADGSGSCYKLETGKEPVRISVNRNFGKGLTAVQSRSHSSREEKEFFSRLEITDSLAVGSSLKFCMVAEGKAHIYYRHGPTWEWDTAAGHAVAESAGAHVSGLHYNKEVIKNDSFYVSSIEIPGAKEKP